jgi:hypothetical protein
MDPFNGVKITEEELKRRECYQEISSIMSIGMLYSSLNNSKKECSTPEQRRNLLLHKFHEKFTSDNTGRCIKNNSASYGHHFTVEIFSQARSYLILIILC